MTAEADQIGPARVPLPDIPAYLRSVYELGRRSLRPALPALALLFFYRLGMGAYGALTNYSYPPGRGALGLKVVGIAELLLFLVFTPFLIYPLQESLLRGRPLHFLGAIRRVLEGSVMLSGIAQALILLAPSALIAVLGAFLRPDPLSLLHWTTLSEMLFAFFFLFMIFATPAAVLDGEGPLRSLRTSYHLVSRNLGSALGRIIAFSFLAVVGYMVVTSPALILSGLSAAPAPIKLAAVIWTSAADALFLLFWVAAVLVLYRSLRPWTDTPLASRDQHIQGKGENGPLGQK